MKTKNLNYVEAMQALADGKCLGIRRDVEGWNANGGDYLYLADADVGSYGSKRLMWKRAQKQPYMFESHALATDWELVLETISTEMKGTLSFGVDGEIYAGLYLVSEMLERKGLAGRKVRILVETID